MPELSRWRPSNNESFYYIGRKLKVEWDSYSVDGKEYVESGNCFKTREDAQAVLDLILPYFEINYTPTDTQVLRDTEIVSDIANEDDGMELVIGETE